MRVDVRIETAATMPEEYRFQSLSADYWSAIGPDGVTQPDVGSSAAYSCVDPDKTGLPLQLAPASKYRGSVVLDVADVTGTLVFTLPTGGPGWEWQYGVNA